MTDIFRVKKNLGFVPLIGYHLVQWLRALPVLLKVPSSIPSNHMFDD